MPKLVDAHCHLHEFEYMELSKYCSAEDLVVIAVSDDYTSSLKTLEISSRCRSVVPAVGLHPWNVGRVDYTREAESISRLADRVRLLGEVGIDMRFTPGTYDRQLEVFRRFLEVAREYNLGINLHAADAWEEALELLNRYDVGTAIVHWYTGPVELLKRIEHMGYYITVNPAVRVQERLRKVVERAPLEVILTESDGPYVYRGLRLTPAQIPAVVSEVASVKGLSAEEVADAVYRNYLELASRLGLR